MQRIVVLAVLAAAAQGAEKVPAFPGAEGAGMYASGGRGGSVYRVTNLDAKGPGSLAEAVSGANRTVVFAVSGIIDLGGASIKITEPNITIAGQTAPGEGICVRGGALAISASNVIVRHLRIRRGRVSNGNMGDALNIKGEQVSDVIADHISTSWATDENLTLTNAKNVTAQYSIAAEALDYFNYRQTPPRHAFGSLFGSATPGAFMTIHHSIYAHNRLRNARTTGGEWGPPVLDFRNNVIYDAKELTSHTGSQPVHANWVGNVVKDGPSTGMEGHDVKGVLFTFMSAVEHRLYASGNRMEGYPDRSTENWLAVRYGRSGKKVVLKERDVRALEPFATPYVTTQNATDAYAAVLDEAGATLPARDLVDWRIIRDIRNGTGAVINTEMDLAVAARWPEYQSLAAPADTDRDGIPDDWEDQFGLNKRDASDGAVDGDGDGYTNLEECLNNTHPKGGREPLVFVSAHVSRGWRGAGEGGVFRIHRGDAGAALKVQTSLGAVTIPTGKRFVEWAVPATQPEDRVVMEIVAKAGYKVGLPRAAVVVMEEGLAPLPVDVRKVDSKGLESAEDREGHQKVLEEHQVKKDEKEKAREAKRARKP